jgi:predicted small integral membrane protein
MQLVIKSKRMRWEGHVARMVEKRNAYRLLVVKLEGERPVGKPRRTWLDLLEVGWGDVDWIGLAQDRDRWRAVVNSVLNLRVP